MTIPWAQDTHANDSECRTAHLLYVDKDTLCRQRHIVSTVDRLHITQQGIHYFLYFVAHAVDVRLFIQTSFRIDTSIDI